MIQCKNYLTVMNPNKSNPTVPIGTVGFSKIRKSQTQFRTLTSNDGVLWNTPNMHIAHCNELKPWRRVRDSFVY